MASFGEGLRREREMRGITLEEISAHTKISIHFLQAIEADDLGKLPGGIYTRNFIRAFARYLGLDEEKVMNEYQSFAHPGRDFDLSRLTSARPTRESRAGTWIGLLLAAAMLTGGYLLFRYSQRTAGAPQSAAQAAPRQGRSSPLPRRHRPSRRQAPKPSPAPRAFLRPTRRRKTKRIPQVQRRTPPVAHRRRRLVHRRTPPVPRMPPPQTPRRKGLSLPVPKPTWCFRWRPQSARGWISGQTARPSSSTC